MLNDKAGGDFSDDCLQSARVVRLIQYDTFAMFELDRANVLNGILVVRNVNQLTGPQIYVW